MLPLGFSLILGQKKPALADRCRNLLSNQELVIVDFIIQILLEGILRLLQRLAHVRALAGDDALNYCGQFAVQLLRKTGSSERSVIVPCVMESKKSLYRRISTLQYSSIIACFAAL